MTTAPWNLIALLTGSVIYLATLHRFASYSERNATSGPWFLLFALSMFAAGAALTYWKQAAKARIGLSLTGGVLIAHTIAIAIDVSKDPTDHNLLPFEYILMAIISLPAPLGAAIARLLKST